MGLIENAMKEFLCVWVDDAFKTSVTTEFAFPAMTGSTVRFDRNDPLYRNLVAVLRTSSPECHTAIRLLEQARKDARYDYKDLHPSLARELMAWRRKKAREAGYPAFAILHQKVLLSIADQRPLTEEALLSIPGFGPGLFARHGREILAITNQTPADPCPSNG